MAEPSANGAPAAVPALPAEALAQPASISVEPKKPAKPRRSKKQIQQQQQSHVNFTPMFLLSNGMVVNGAIPPGYFPPHDGHNQDHTDWGVKPQGGIQGMPDWTSHTGGHHPGFPGMVGPGRPMHGHPHLMQQQMMMGPMQHSMQAGQGYMPGMQPQPGMPMGMYGYPSMGMDPKSMGMVRDPNVNPAESKEEKRRRQLAQAAQRYRDKKKQKQREAAIEAAGGTLPAELDHKFKLKTGGHPAHAGETKEQKRRRQFNEAAHRYRDKKRKERAQQASNKANTAGSLGVVSLGVGGNQNNAEGCVLVTTTDGSVAQQPGVSVMLPADGIQSCAAGVATEQSGKGHTDVPAGVHDHQQDAGVPEGSQERQQQQQQSHTQQGNADSSMVQTQGGGCGTGEQESNGGQSGHECSVDGIGAGDVKT